MTPTNAKPANFANTCRLRKVDGTPCGHRIENVPLAVPIIGQKPEDRALRLAEAMGRHIWKSHTEIASAVEQGGKVYQAFLIGQTFMVEDPNAAKLLEHFRRELVISIPRPFISDESLLRLSETLSDEPEQVQRIMLTMAQLRNQLTEMQPGVPSQSQLVTPA